MMAKSKKEKQQTLEATLGRPRVRPPIKTAKAKTKPKAGGDKPASSSPFKKVTAASSSPRAPLSSFMNSLQLRSSQQGESGKKRRVILGDSSSDGSDQENEIALPVREKKRNRERRASDSLFTESSSSPSDKQEDDSDDGEDGKPLAKTPTSGRRSGRERRVVLDDSDEEIQRCQDSSPIKRRRLIRGNAASSPATRVEEDESGEPHKARVHIPSSARARRTGRKPRAEREKALELLRRKRAGEIIDEDEESSSSEDGRPAKALYDYDSDHQALSEFEDDEEGVLGGEAQEGKKGKNKKGKGKKKRIPKSNGNDGSDTSMDDFIVDDSDAPLGMPDDLEMPLQFTAHARKPLKEHFRDAVEWLVQFKVNPGFSDKGHELYQIAWRKLDDEVRGLAQSKFASASWNPDFTKALRARPSFTNQELAIGDVFESENCGACGRGNHPAKWVISFTGSPYFKDHTKDNFLEPVEPESDSGSAADDYDEDEDGNEIPKETKKWFIGAVCNSNAETAHTLTHWKHELLEWVDTRLHEEGYMAPGKLAERARMRPKQKYKLVDEILKRWVDTGIVRTLYQTFKNNIEQARNKSTTGRRQRG
ncbi:hypothetical protein VTK56DRAFT_6872 [Thermocarpiscus australiensis]